MRSRVAAVAVASVLAGVAAAGQAPRRPHLNPMIDLLADKKPVFGLYAPAPPRGGGGGRAAAGAANAAGSAAAATPPAPAPTTPAPTPAELARQALAYTAGDYVFSGSMEGSVERGLPAFAEFAAGMSAAGVLIKAPAPRLSHPLIVKTPKIATDPAKAIENISQQLNVGVSGVMFVNVESAEEVRQGLAAMRFKSRGGTRPDAAGGAPAYWGMTEAEYRDKADLWPLNPDGELVNWTIVESKAGLARVREIAAVKGIGVLWPGAGTLRGVFTTTGPDGQRTFDAEGWEGAIQQVLAACKEFNVACGYPANATDIETRMKQGFSVFVMNWGDGGFKAVDAGRKAAGR